MPIDASIPLGFKPTDPMQSISGMLNVSRNMLAYRRDQDTYDTDVAQRKAESSSATSKSTVDAANVNPLIQQQAAQTSQAQTQDQSTQFKLQNDYMGAALQTATGLAADPRIADVKNYDPQKAVEALSEARDQMISKGVPKHVAEVATARYMASVGQPGAVSQMLSNTIKGQMTAPQQQDANQPGMSFVGTQGGMQPYNTKTGVPGAPVGPMGQPMAPPNQFVTTPQGRMATANAASGTANEVQSGGAANQMPVNLPPGETDETRKTVLKYRSDANDAATNAGSQAFNANQIIKYSKDAITGTGKDWLTKSAAIFPGLPLSGDKATDTQLLGHAIAQQSASLADQAGLSGSNAKIAIAQEMTADGKWTPDAIRASARVMRAIGSTGPVLYNQGMENAVSSGDQFAARTFRNNWSSATSSPGGVDGIRLYDAKRHASEDPEGLKQTVDSLGGVSSPRYKAALQRIDQLGSIIRGK